jgi:MFS family permease
LKKAFHDVAQLFNTLFSLKGNPRGCVYAEPLWGIPFNLYSPYISVYMVALGLVDRQIGSIVSISWGFQLVMALSSGIITDKLGRRLTTLIFDIVAWSIPALISALAQNYWFFLAAGIMNSVWRITQNSWTCLLVEDAEKDKLADIYTWIYIANIIVGFIAPLAGEIIRNYSLVPTVRGLYFFAAFMFTFKAVVTYLLTRETAQGKVRLHETHHQNAWEVLKEYRGVFVKIFRSPQTLYAAGIMLIMSIASVINGSFWAIIVTEKLRFPVEQLAYFPFIKSFLMLTIFLFVTPILNRMHFKLPMLFGFIGSIISHFLLITAPDRNYFFLIASIFLEACSFAAVSPLVDRMIALAIDPQERARIQSLLYVGIILFTSPFGWIAGTLSGMDKRLPFVLDIALFLVGALLAWLAGTASQKSILAETAVPAAISETLPEA